MTLKTLKDISLRGVKRRDVVGRRLVDYYEAKALAIKWVKNFRERKDEIWESDFMEFHNITEDDLK